LIKPSGTRNRLFGPVIFLISGSRRMCQQVTKTRLSRMVNELIPRKSFHYDLQKSLRRLLTKR
jgi:hypothetical protein